VRGAVLAQAVAVVWFRALAPADVGLVGAPVRECWPVVFARPHGPLAGRDVGILGAGVSQRNLRGQRALGGAYTERAIVADSQPISQPPAT
jgi:hypothetical protein